MCLLCSCMSFILFPFCLIVSLCSKFICPGGCIVNIFSAMSFLSVPITLECSWLCSWEKWSKHSINLPSVFGQLAFDISFLRQSSADMGMAFICLFVLVIVHCCVMMLWMMWLFQVYLKHHLLWNTGTSIHSPCCKRPRWQVSQEVGNWYICTTKCS